MCRSKRVVSETVIRLEKYGAEPFVCRCDVIESLLVFRWENTEVLIYSILGTYQYHRSICSTARINAEQWLKITYIGCKYRCLIESVDEHHVPVHIRKWRLNEASLKWVPAIVATLRCSLCSYLSLFLAPGWHCCLQWNVTANIQHQLTDNGIHL